MNVGGSGDEIVPNVSCGRVVLMVSEECVEVVVADVGGGFSGVSVVMRGSSVRGESSECGSVVWR